MKKQFFLFTFLTFLSMSLMQAQEVTEASSDSQKDSGGAFVAAKKIKDSLYSLSYRGNNVVAFLGRDYTVLIDGHDENAAPQTLTTAGRLSLNSVRFLVNTHHHNDRTGGNAYFSDSGVTILANEQTYNNVWADTNKELLQDLKVQRATLAEAMKSSGKSGRGEELSSKYNRLSEQNIEKALDYPVMTFTDKFKMSLDNETITFTQVLKAHSGADVFAFFENNNVLATGDLFINGKYPFIDEEFKGSIDGYLAGINQLIGLCNNDTVVVPGHGPIASKSDLEAYKRMIEYTQKGVQMDFLLGKSLEEVLANKSITANFDAKGYGNGNVKTKDYLSMLYRAAEKRYPKKN
jgi:cyclase